MRTALALLALLGAAACHPTAPKAAVATSCEPGVIGRVTASGVHLSRMPQLAVLEGTFDDAARTERIATLATAALHAAGYPRAKIAVERATGCGVELTFVATLGPKFRIATLAFVTDDVFPAAKRLALIEDGLGTVNTIGGTYLEDRLERALRELRRRYRDAGWAVAEIEKPMVRYDDMTGEIAIQIPIHAGPRFKIGTIRAIGAGRAGRAVIDALGLREGEYYDKSQVSAGIERARKQLDRWIQLRVEVAPERTEIDVEAIVEGR